MNNVDIRVDEKDLESTVRRYMADVRSHLKQIYDILDSLNQILDSEQLDEIPNKTRLFKNLACPTCGEPLTTGLHPVLDDVCYCMKCYFKRRSELGLPTISALPLPLEIERR